MAGNAEPRAPLVSAVVIFCNEERFLAEAVASVRAQTEQDWELILVDDGSTDASTAMARAWAEAEPERIRYLDHPRHEQRGMSASRNQGVAAARGCYVAYLDADDAWLPEKLERQLALAARHPEARLVYGPLRRWYSWTGRPDDQRDDRYGLDGHRFRLRPGTMLQPPRLAEVIIEHKDLVPSGALFERELFHEIGGADDRFTDNYEDAVVFAKMGLLATALVADDSWYRYRQYPRPEDRADRAAGRPDAGRVRGDAARARFLDWAEDHLRAEGRTDAGLHRALRRARRQVAGDRRMAPLEIAEDRARSALGRARSAARVARVAGRAAALGAQGQLRRVAIADISDEFAFSLADDGWEPLREALRNHARQPSAPVGATAFGRFLAAQTTNDVRDLNDLLDLVDTPLRFADLPRFWLGTYPWGGVHPTDVGRPGPAFGWAHDEATGRDTSQLWGRGRTMWYRPDDRFTIASEWERTIALDRSMATGYRPARAGGFPLVTMLQHTDGRRRAIIVDGHHRLAVLAHRGARAATVEIGATIDRADADRWCHVRDGTCTADEAVRFFDAFFDLDGSERFRAVASRWEDSRVG